MDKIQLRQLLRQRRRGIPAGRQKTAARGVLAQLLRLPEFCRAQQVALYLPRDGEIDPGRIKTWLWKNERTCYVPIILPGRKLAFAELHPDSDLSENRLHIDEPQDTPRLDPQALDIVLLPLVGFDPHGNRLGMGGGFYDTTFADHAPGAAPLLIGLAHEEQRVEQLPTQAQDVPLDYMVTGRNLYHCARL